MTCKGQEVINIKIRIDKLIPYIQILIYGIVIVIALIFSVKILDKKYTEDDFFRRTKCINNELFYKNDYKDRDYINQNRKCAVINDEVYIYENGNLKKLEIEDIENNIIEILEIKESEEREGK